MPDPITSGLELLDLSPIADSIKTNRLSLVNPTIGSVEILSNTMGYQCLMTRWKLARYDQDLISFGGDLHHIWRRGQIYSRFGRNLLKFANFNGIIQRIWLTMRGGGGERQGFWSNLSNWVSFNKNNHLTCQYLTFLTHTYCPLPHYSNRSSFDLGGSGLDKFLRFKSLMDNTLVLI